MTKLTQYERQEVLKYYEYACRQAMRKDLSLSKKFCWAKEVISSSMMLITAQ